MMPISRERFDEVLREISTDGLEPSRFTELVDELHADFDELHRERLPDPEIAEWKNKYYDLKKEYVDRFFSGKREDEDTKEDVEEDAEVKQIDFDDLFVNDESEVK